MTRLPCHALAGSRSRASGRRLAAALRPPVAARRPRCRDRRHRADRAEGPRLRGDRRRAAAERAVRGGRGRDHLRALLHVAPDLDRARARRWPRSRAARSWSPASRASRPPSSSRRSRCVTGLLFLALALLRLGWISRFLSKAVDHRVPGGRRRRRRDRRAAQAHGDRRRRGRTRGASSARGSARSATCTGRRCVVGRARAGADPRAALPRARRAGRAGARGRRGSSRRTCSTSGRTASRSSATCRAGCRRRSCPTSTWSRTHLATVVVAAIALLLIGFSQTAGDARAFAARHRYRIDVDQESVAQGMANVGAGVFQGMPVSTSLSASSLNESAGARTPMASLITGALVLLTLLFLAPLFSDLPKAVLGAVIIDAVVFGMIDVRRAAPPPPRRAVRLLDRGRGDRRRAVVGRARRGGRSASCSRSAGSSTSRRRRRCRCSAASAGRRCSATSTSTRATRRSPASSCCASTAACSSRRAQALEDRVRALAEDGRAPLERRRPRPRGRQLHRLAGRRAARDDPRARRERRRDAAARAREAERARRAPRGRLRRARLGADHIHGNVHRAVEAQLHP